MKSNLIELMDKGVALDDLPDNALSDLHATLSAMIGFAMIAPEEDNGPKVLQAAWTIGAELMDEIRLRPTIKTQLVVTQEERQSCWNVVKEFARRSDDFE